MSKFHDDCHIVISKYGIQRMTKRPGKLAKGEIAVKVRLVVPTSLFADPEPSAVITIPESFAIHPEIEVEAVAPQDGQSDSLVGTHGGTVASQEAREGATVAG